MREVCKKYGCHLRILKPQKYLEAAFFPDSKIIILKPKDLKIETDPLIQIITEETYQEHLISTISHEIGHSLQGIRCPDTMTNQEIIEMEIDADNKGRQIAWAEFGSMVFYSSYKSKNDILRCYGRKP